MDSIFNSSGHNSMDYLKDSYLKKTETTDKKKKLADMSNDEKRAHYDEEIARLKEKIRQAEEKRDRIGSVTEKQRNHALILFGSHFITREQLFEWYQLPAKERDKAIRDYALKIKNQLKEGV